MSRYAPLPTRFEQKIDKRSKNECWTWLSASSGRYGVFWFNGRNVFAHRFSYELYVGIIPDGMHVCHKCDNAMCVNPNHLFLGTAKDNVRDCSDKGRRAPQHGSFNPMAKISDLAVIQIRMLHEVGTPQEEIAAYFGVKRQAIGKVLRGERWMHVK